jgi:hypothetical protein
LGVDALSLAVHASTHDGPSSRNPLVCCTNTLPSWIGARTCVGCACTKGGVFRADGRDNLHRSYRCRRSCSRVFFEVVCLGSLCCLREMKVFDEEVLLARCTGGLYGWAPPIPMPAKPTRTCPRIPLSPRWIIKYLNNFITSKYHKNDSFY